MRYGTMFSEFIECEPNFQSSSEMYRGVLSMRNYVISKYVWCQFQLGFLKVGFIEILPDFLGVKVYLY